MISHQTSRAFARRATIVERSGTPRDRGVRPVVAAVAVLANVLVAAPAIAQTISDEATGVLTRLERASSFDAYGHRKDRAGSSVSIRGNRALVGAPQETSCLGQGIDGEVYVFERESAGSDWVFVSRLSADTGGDECEFGTSVSLGPDRAVVGSPRALTDDQDLGAVYVFDLQSGEWTRTARISPPDGQAGDSFGRSVALDGDRLLVGSPLHEVDGEILGAAYVLERNGNDWPVAQKLTADTAGTFPQFGDDLDLEGDRALIGAPRDNRAGQDAGAAFVFERVAGTWTQQAVLTALDAGPGDTFGRAVSLDGGVALIGSPRDDSGSQNAGSAYVFEFDGLGWVERQKLLRSAGIEDDFFGSAVTLIGGQALIGAPAPKDPSGSRASVSLFERNDGAWTETQILEPDDAPLGERFGTSLALSDDTILVGAPWDDELIEERGASYAFEPSADGWQPRQKLAVSDSERFDRYGCSVDLSAHLVIVSACDDSASGDETGSVSIFEFGGSRWTEIDQLVPADYVDIRSIGGGVISDEWAFVRASMQIDVMFSQGVILVFQRVNGRFEYFGRILSPDTTDIGFGGSSISLHQNRLLIGQLSREVDGLEVGAAYLYEFDGSEWVLLQELFASDLPNSDNFGQSVSLGADRLVVGAPFTSDPVAGDSVGAAYVFEWIGGAFVETAKLVSPDAPNGGGFGWSVAIDGDDVLVGNPWYSGLLTGSGAAYMFEQQGPTWTFLERFLPTEERVGGWFGHAVDVDDGLAIVGAAITVNQELHVFERHGENWPLRNLVTTDAESSLFAASLDLDGKQAIIGAMREDGGSRAHDAGMAYIADLDRVFRSGFEAP